MRMHDKTYPERLRPQAESLLVRAQSPRLRLLRREQVPLPEHDVPQRVQIFEALSPQLRRRPRTTCRTTQTR